MLDRVGEVMIGVTYGLQYGLLAIGLVLVWRAGRFVNFAHAQIGVLGALLLGRLVRDLGMPYLPGLLLSLAFGAGAAVALERLLVRPLANAPRLVLLIGTIGIAQTAFALGTFSVFGQRSPFLPTNPGRSYPVPFHGTWDIGSVGLSSSKVLTLVVAPLLVVGLQVLFTRTELGRTIRAASANPEAARLAGISVRRVSMQVWAIAGLLSTFTAVLQAPDTTTIDVSTLGPTLLVRGLAAALLAGMTDFRLALGAGVVLGIVEAEVLFHVGAKESNLVVFAAILLAVLLRAPALARGARAGDDRVSEPRSRTPLTERMQQVSFARNLDRYGWAALVLALAAAPFLPGLDEVQQYATLTILVGLALLVVSMTLLTGWAGQVSLGHVALLGVGAYSASEAVRHGWALPLVLVFSGLVTAAVAVPVGLPALRFRGLFLAVTTLGFAVVAPTYLFRLGVLGERSTGYGGVRLDQLRLPWYGELTSRRQVYFAGLVVLLLVLAALSRLRRTGPGRALLAVRDNEGTAAAHGLPPVAVKVVALALSGFIAGLAGAVWATGKSSWNFEIFDANLSLAALGALVVGGVESLPGAVLGALLVFGPSQLFSSLDSPSWRAFFSGALLLTVLRVVPGGLSQILTSVREWLLRWVERGLPPKPFGAVEGAAPLRVRSVSLAFGGIQALAGVSFDVGPGEIVGLIGGNGAGKSTLMSCVSGHLVPDSGSIEVFGQEVAGLPPEFRPHLSLARTFQDARLYPGLTVLETVLVALDRTDRSDTLSALVGAPWTRAPERGKRDRALALLEQVGLHDRQDTLVSELSTGMRRLLDLATVMAGEPALVLLDEPTAGIAQREVEQFAPLLRRLRDDLGCAIVIVEHDMPLLLSLCDRVYCLENGEVIASGTPQQVRDDPRVVASYLGTDPIAVGRSTAASPTAVSPTASRRRPVKERTT